MELTPAGEYFLIMAAVSFLSTFVGRILPKEWFDYKRFPYRDYSFEKEGKIYLALRINKWHKRVPDMSKVFKKLFPAKNLECCSAEKLRVLLRETCIAEFIHSALCVVGYLLSRYLEGPWVKFLTWLYILVGNMPFILIQRYNRPRLKKLLRRMELQEMSV